MARPVETRTRSRTARDNRADPIDEMMPELVGKVQGTGAKAIADIQNGQVLFRGAVKKTVPASELSAEVRGNLLLILYGDMTMEFNAGSKAAGLAKKINIG